MSVSKFSISNPIESNGVCQSQSWVGTAQTLIIPSNVLLRTALKVLNEN